MPCNQGQGPAEAHGHPIRPRVVMLNAETARLDSARAATTAERRALSAPVTQVTFVAVPLPDSGIA